jgi:hypothetical protein
LLSGNNIHDDWPEELILLREKLTAANQLEITQLKIKHEEEMSRLKGDLERKIKRHAAFDENRNLEEILSERDNLRELSESLRFTLCELAKCVNQCENDPNISVQDESLNDPNFSTISANTKRFVTYKPDVSNLLAVVEDPKLLGFISNTKENDNGNSLGINIVDYLSRLKLEANNILVLTEQINQRNARTSNHSEAEKADSCEEEDGLKRNHLFQSLGTPKRGEARTVDEFKSLPVVLDKSKVDEELKSGDSGSQIDEDDEHKRALIELRSKVRELFTTPSKRNTSIDSYQLYEDFCRATDYFVEGEHQLRDDLLRQVRMTCMFV